MTPEEDQELTKLEQDRVVLASQLSEIDAQLAQKRRFDPDGTMWDVAKYHRWRASAVRAKTHVLNELRAANARLKELRVKRTAAGAYGGPSARDLISGAHTLLWKLVEEGVDLDPEEIALVNSMGEWLKKPVQ